MTLGSCGCRFWTSTAVCSPPASAAGCSAATSTPRACGLPSEFSQTSKESTTPGWVFAGRLWFPKNQRPSSDESFRGGPSESSERKIGLMKPKFLVELKTFSRP